MTARRQLLTVAEAAELLNVHPIELNRQCRAGLIDAISMPSGYRVPRWIVKRILDKRNGGKK